MTQQQIGSRLPGKACKAKCLFGVSSIVRKFCLVSYMIYNMYNKLMRHGLFVYNVCFVDYLKFFQTGRRSTITGTSQLTWAVKY